MIGVRPERARPSAVFGKDVLMPHRLHAIEVLQLSRSARETNKVSTQEREETHLV